MKGYIVVAHSDESVARAPLRAFALLGEDHHEAVSRVRHLDAQMQIDGKRRADPTFRSLA